MSKTILVCGYGPGISNSVVRRFAREGFRVGVVARRTDKLAEARRSLEEGGIVISTFAADLSDPAAAKDVVARARAQLGRITALHWNAFSPGVAGDLMAVEPAAVHEALDVAVTSLLAAVREAHPDLNAERGAVLVTNGGFGHFDPQINAAAVQVSAMGLAVACAAKHKVVGVLAERLRPQGIYVGEVMVFGVVKGTPFDRGDATIDPSRVADRFWELYTKRRDVSVNVSTV
jgi:NAD(P)-dependent dehydrogenase (short-subunit alcohol dehydrogenase family)